MKKRTRQYRKYRPSKMLSDSLTIDNKPIWELLKNYINNMPTGNIFTRQEMLHVIYKRPWKLRENVADKYRCQLDHVEILKTIKPGKYEKLKDIPDQLTTSKLKEVGNKNSWKSWFMSVDYL